MNLRFQLTLKKKEDYVVIALALILMTIVFAIAFFSFRVSEPPETVTPLPTTAPAPTRQEEGSNPLVEYDIEAQARLLQRVNTRPALSADDAAAKARILTLLPAGKQSGILFENANARVEYVNSADLFIVELLSIDIAQGKADANVWFRSRGMSQQGLCNLPVMFYLNAAIAKNVQELNIKFSPVASSC